MRAAPDRNPRPVSFAFHRAQQIVGSGTRRLEANVGLLGREVHRGAGHARDTLQRLLNTRGAGRTGHPLEIQNHRSLAIAASRCSCCDHQTLQTPSGKSLSSIGFVTPAWRYAPAASSQHVMLSLAAAKGFRQMTFLNTRYRLAGPLKSRELEGLARLSTVYGIRRLSLEGQVLLVEYDASRLHEAEVLAAVRGAGLKVSARETHSCWRVRLHGRVQRLCLANHGPQPCQSRQK